VSLDRITARDELVIEGLAEALALALEQRSTEFSALLGLSHTVPLHTLGNNFKVQIMGSRGLPVSKGCTVSKSTKRAKRIPAGAKVQVEVNLFHGGKSLCSPVAADPAPLVLTSREDKMNVLSCSWAQHAVMDIRYCNLPAATRCVFNVRHGPEEPAGWAGLSLFDFQQVLRCGEIELRLWPGVADAHMAATTTSLSNDLDENAPSLIIALHRFRAPVARVAVPRGFLAAATRSAAAKQPGLAAALRA